MEFFRKNPAADRLRGPIFEDKVIDFVLELAKVTTRLCPRRTGKGSAVAEPRLWPEWWITSLCAGEVDEQSKARRVRVLFGADPASKTIHLSRESGRGG